MMKKNIDKKFQEVYIIHHKCLFLNSNERSGICGTLVRVSIWLLIAGCIAAVAVSYDKSHFKAGKNTHVYRSSSGIRMRCRPRTRKFRSISGLSRPMPCRSTSGAHQKRLLRGVKDSHGPQPQPGFRAVHEQGSAACGPHRGRKPIEAVENIDAKMDLSALGVDNGKEDYFALTVKGNSMINAHIMDGDMVVVKKQPV